MILINILAGRVSMMATIITVLIAYGFSIIDLTDGN